MLDLQRTNLAAPFTGVVLEENSEVGQLVGPQTRLVTMAGVDKFWVEATLPAGKIPWIDFDARPETKVYYGKEIIEGRVTGFLADLSKKGRMARVVVEVEDPLGLKTGNGRKRGPLLLGSFVRVEIQGRPLKGVIRLPRTALRENDTVWTVGKNMRLRIRKVDVAWKEEDYFFVSSGIEPGEKVVTDLITSPIPGMKLKIADK